MSKGDFQCHLGLKAQPITLGVWILVDQVELHYRHWSGPTPLKPEQHTESDQLHPIAFRGNRISSIPKPSIDGSNSDTAAPQTAETSTAWPGVMDAEAGQARWVYIHHRGDTKSIGPFGKCAQLCKMMEKSIKIAKKTSVL